VDFTAERPRAQRNAEKIKRKRKIKIEIHRRDAEQEGRKPLMNANRHKARMTTRFDGATALREAECRNPKPESESGELEPNREH
jgi:hypothetical protein